MAACPVRWAPTRQVFSFKKLQSFMDSFDRHFLACEMNLRYRRYRSLSIKLELITAKRAIQRGDQTNKKLRLDCLPLCIARIAVTVAQSHFKYKEMPIKRVYENLQLYKQNNLFVGARHWTRRHRYSYFGSTIYSQSLLDIQLIFTRCSN